MRISDWSSDVCSSDLLAAHAEIAKQCQVPQQIVGRNGAVIRLAPGEAAIVDDVPSGRLVYDGRRLLSRDSPVLKGRQKLMYNGAVAVTLVLDERGIGAAACRDRGWPSV